MSSQDVTNSINHAMNQNQIGGAQMSQQQPLYPVQETVLTKQVFDPNTGRSIVVDANGRRVTPRRDMTGTQLVRINSMRQQAGLKYLSDHNVAQMSIDSASLMIDDLMYFIRKIQSLEETLTAWESAHPAYVESVQERQARDAQAQTNRRR